MNAPSAGAYTLTFRYSSPNLNRTLRIRVNSTVANSGLAFPPTGSGTNWQTVSISATLNAGSNLVRATTIGSGGPNMDNLVVK